MSNPDAEIELGLEVIKFLETDIGKYLEGCSRQDVEDAKGALLAIDPYAYTELQKLQNAIAEIQRKALIAESLRAYLSEAILNARQAAEPLEPEDAD